MLATVPWRGSDSTAGVQVDQVGWNGSRRLCPPAGIQCASPEGVPIARVAPSHALDNCGQPNQQSKANHLVRPPSPWGGNPRPPARQSSARRHRCHSSCGRELVPFDAMVPPTRDPQIAPMKKDRRRCFARATHHRQGAGKFAIPGLQRMDPCPTILKAKSIIPRWQHINQSTRWAGIGVVIDAKKIPFRLAQ